jgi:hypothetical protein
MEIAVLDKFIEEKYPDEVLSNTFNKSWSGFFRTNNYIAGKFKSKGLKVYRMLWDLENKSFYCNCSNPQNPCSHGIDLYFRFKHQYSEFKVVDELDNEFSDLRAKAIPFNKKRSDYYTSEDLERLEESRSKSRSDRIQLMIQGAKVLQNWIEDALSMGLADLLIKPIDYWQDIASTMVNYKLNALSDRILDFAYSETGSSDDRYTESIHFLSDLFLFVRAFSKIDQIPASKESLLRSGGLKVMTKELELEVSKPSKAVVISVDQWHQNSLYFEKYLWLEIETGKMMYVQNSTWEGAYDRNKSLPFKEGDIINGSFVSYGYNQRYYLKNDYTKLNLFDFNLDHYVDDFELVYSNFRALLGRQIVLKEYFFTFKYSGIISKNELYYLRDSTGKYIELEISREDYFKLLYKRNPASILILKQDYNKIFFVSFLMIGVN